MRRALILDLDGTLCLGDEPARHYARRIAELAPDVDGVADLPAILEAFLTGSPSPEADARPSAEDGYMTVWSAALALGVPQGVVSSAFLDTRAGVVAGTIPTHAPADAAEQLDSLRAQGVVTVLVTNSPGNGLDALLDRLGLLPHLDRVVTGAGKPDGLGAVLDGLLTDPELAADARRILSVGDIWVNDLAPVHARGGLTAHLDRHGLGTGTPTLRRASVVDLYPDLADWAR